MMNIMKALQCGFCRIETFPKSADTCVAGWIAEHHLGLSRCYVHIFYHVRDILEYDAYGIDHYDMMIQSLMCMVYRLMSPYTIPLIEIENYIKCFLQSVHNFEKHSHSFATDTYMIWWKRGNFLSLLNLCDQIKSFGSIRWYWDGSRERFIQFVKPFMSNMRNTSSYLKIQYNRVQQSNLLNDLLQTYDTSISDEPRYLP